MKERQAYIRTAYNATDCMFVFVTRLDARQEALAALPAADVVPIATEAIESQTTSRGGLLELPLGKEHIYGGGLQEDDFTTCACERGAAGKVILSWADGEGRVAREGNAPKKAI